MEILASQARICLPLREIETGGWSGSILMLSRLALLGPPVSVAIQERVNSPPTRPAQTANASIASCSDRRFQSLRAVTASSFTGYRPARCNSARTRTRCGVLNSSNAAVARPVCVSPTMRVPSRWKCSIQF